MSSGHTLCHRCGYKRNEHVIIGGPGWPTYTVTYLCPTATFKDRTA